MYINQLTFLRFLGALIVVTHHFGQKSWPFYTDLFSPILVWGSFIVSFFYFLSGVVLGLNYLDKPDFNTKRFYITRLARVYPVYIVAFIATLVLGMTLRDTYPRGLSIILQFLGLHAWVPGIVLEINFPSYSVAVELFFYMVFPLILIMAKRMSHLNFALLVIIIWLLSAVQHYGFYNYVHGIKNFGQFNLYFPLWHLNVFLAGLLCARYIREKQQSTYYRLVHARILYITGIIIFTIAVYTPNMFRPYFNNGLMAPVFFMIVAGLALDKSIFTRILGNKTFVLLGNASYPFYILQFPVYIAFCHILGRENVNGIYFFPYIITLLILSITTYLYYESKMKKLIVNKWVKR